MPESQSVVTWGHRMGRGWTASGHKIQILYPNYGSSSIDVYVYFSDSSNWVHLLYINYTLVEVNKVLKNILASDQLEK